MQKPEKMYKLYTHQQFWSMEVMVDWGEK